ncbi:MAG: photosynthetic complex putative assembly protein PuhB [Paracoccaceae bacterium]|jgi:hypothetical protein|nr:photosynthetic complex putative assembly protein PuhB [Paracoccaceae bacterium]
MMDHDHDDFAFEHSHGLPEPLPPGEDMLWQGKPNAWRLAVESLLLKWVIGYFALLTVWRVVSALADHPASVAFASALPPIVLGLAAVGLLYGFSWLQARQAVYTVTTSRVILRTGAALQVTLQMPFSKIENIALDLRKTGTGTIAFEPARDGGAQLSYLVLWPHVRPWHARLPQPAFRCIPDAQHVAEILAEAAEGKLAQPKIARAGDAPARPAGAGPVPAE